MTPALVIRNVEVVSIHPMGFITLIVHLNGKTPQDLHTLETKDQIAENAQRTCNYLRDEGFLDGCKTNEWRLAASVILHPELKP